MPSTHRITRGLLAAAAATSLALAAAPTTAADPAPGAVDPAPAAAFLDSGSLPMGSIAAVLGDAPAPGTDTGSIAGIDLGSAFGVPADLLDPPTADDVGQLNYDVYLRTNAYRADNGVRAVALDARVSAIAQAWSEKQAAEDHMHHNPNLRAQLYALDTPWRSYGENVLQNWNTPRGRDAGTLVRQWAKSTPHRLNMLNPVHTHMGVGSAVAESGKLYSTQVFVRFG